MGVVFPGAFRAKGSRSCLAAFFKRNEFAHPLFLSFASRLPPVAVHLAEGGWFVGEYPNFGRLVLGNIDANICSSRFSFAVFFKICRGGWVKDR